MFIWPQEVKASQTLPTADPGHSDTLPGFQKEGTTVLCGIFTSPSAPLASRGHLQSPNL